jgi:hypothetical protein
VRYRLLTYIYALEKRRFRDKKFYFFRKGEVGCNNNLSTFPFSLSHQSIAYSASTSEIVLSVVTFDGRSRGTEAPAFFMISATKIIR